MDSVDFENTTGSDLSIIFKVVNLIIATLSWGFLKFLNFENFKMFLKVLCGLSELFSRFDYFFQGIFIIILGILIGYLEFKIPPQLYTYASSFFSFLGRGSIYILISVLNLHGSFFRVITALVILLIGIVYIVLEFVPSIQPPENMQGEQGLSTDVLDDVI